MALGASLSETIELTYESAANRPPENLTLTANSFEEHSTEMIGEISATDDGGQESITYALGHGAGARLVLHIYY